MKSLNHHPHQKSVTFLGLGRLGTLLAKFLIQQNYAVSGTKRTSPSEFPCPVHVMNYPQLPNEVILNSDIIFINIPPFAEQLSWYQKWPIHPHKWIIFISSTSALDENKEARERGNSLLLKEQESYFRSLPNPLTIIRPGGIIFHNSHPGLYLSGKKGIKGKNWPVHLIHIDDLVKACWTIIKFNLQDHIFNIVANDHPSKKDFYTKFCQNHHLPLPQFEESDTSQKKVISMSKDLEKYFTPQKNIYQLG